MRQSAHSTYSELGSSLEDGFNEKIAAAAAEIKQAAAGRTCSDCKHLRNGSWCAKIENVSGDALVVYYPTAVACGHHAPE